jgi:predicted RNase H-like HicB family nuclease
MVSIMRTYTFEIVIEPDDDRWVAYSPLLKEKGGATWGYTREEALKNINEVLEMVVESMIEDGEPVPEESFIETTNTINSEVAIAV